MSVVEAWKKRFFLCVSIFFSLGVIIFMSLSVLKNKSVIHATSGRITYDVPTAQIRKSVLKNGMTVLAYKTDIIPKVLVQIAYDIGSAVEEFGERGLAHLLEHMIFKGTTNLAEGDIDAIARKYGASFNAFTSKDMTSYYFESNKNNWKPFLAILSDCMQNARFDEQHLASELLAVIQELKMYKDSFWHRIFEKASELSYPSNHPYHFPIIGYKEDLVDITGAKLKAFYDKHYTPKHALLVIMGDIDLDEAIGEAEKNFGGIQGPIKDHVIPTIPDIVPDLTAHKTCIYEAVQKEQLGFYWTIPGKIRESEEVVHALCQILGSGEGSRLVKRLVDEEQCAYGMVANSDHLVHAGIFLILVEPKEGKAEECRKLIEEELHKIIKEGVREDELNKLVMGEATKFFHEMESLQELSYEWISNYFITRNEHTLFKKITNLYTISSKSIQTFAASYLDPLFMNQIEIKSIPEDKKALWQTAKDQSDAIDKKILAKHVRHAPIEEPVFVKTLKDPNPLEFSFPKPSATLTLPNGLKVILHKNDAIPLLSVHCAFKDAGYFSGTLDGVLIDMMMGMLMEGSYGFTKEDSVNFFENRGIEYSFDATGASLTLLNKDYRPAFEHFFTVLTKPNFRLEALNKVKAMAMDQYTRSKDSPKEVALRELKNIVYAGHPFSWTFDDAIKLAKNIKVSELVDVHAKHVNPEHLVLSIAGSFDVAAMEKDLALIFKKWESTPYQEPVYGTRDFTPGKRVDHFLLRDQAVLVLGQPSHFNIYHEDLTGIKLLNRIAFGSLGSRLYELRERTGLFYNASGSWAASAEREYGFDFLMAILNPSNLERAEELMRKVIDTLAADGIREDEISAAKQMYLNALIDLSSGISSTAAMLGRLEVLHLGFDYYDKVLKQVQTISIEELNRLAKKYFTTKDMACVRVGRVGKPKK